MCLCVCVFEDISLTLPHPHFNLAMEKCIFSTFPIHVCSVLFFCCAPVLRGRQIRIIFKTESHTHILLASIQRVYEKLDKPPFSLNLSLYHSLILLCVACALFSLSLSVFLFFPIPIHHPTSSLYRRDWKRFLCNQTELGYCKCVCVLVILVFHFILSLFLLFRRVLCTIFFSYRYIFVWVCLLCVFGGCGEHFRTLYFAFSTLHTSGVVLCVRTCIHTVCVGSWIEGFSLVLFRSFKYLDQICYCSRSQLVAWFIRVLFFALRLSRMFVLYCCLSDLIGWYSLFEFEYTHFTY